VKITHISPTILSCEDDKFWQSFTIFFAIGTIGAACFIYGSYTANPSFKIGLYALIIGVGVCLLGSKLTTIFDLNKKSVRFKRYWFIFQYTHNKEYPLSLIKNIEAYRMDENCYPAVRLQNNKILRMTETPNSRTEIERDVAIVKKFLESNSRNTYY
jgi:hypothetical protein